MLTLLTSARPWRAGVAVFATALVVGCAPRVPLPDPSDPTLPPHLYSVPPVFSGYEPFSDLKLQDWRQANDTVHGVGGHEGALKDNAKSSAASPGGHDEHH